MSSQKADQAITMGMGQNGVEAVTGTGAGAAGPWVAIQGVTAFAFSAYTAAGTTGTVTGVTFPAAFVLYGPITAFTLSSGTVMAYKGNIN